MIGRMLSIITSRVGNCASLLTFLSIISTSVLERLFFGKLLVYQWPQCTFVSWFVPSHLWVHVNDFMLRTMKQDMTKAVQFSNTFDYIDDLFHVNNEHFGHYIKRYLPVRTGAKEHNLKVPIMLKNVFCSSNSTVHLMNFREKIFRFG